MRSVTTYRNWLVFGIGAALSILPALAADQPGKDQTRRLQQQLHMAEQEKARLAQQTADAEKQIKEAQEKVATAERRSDAVGYRSARLNKELEAVKVEKEALVVANKAEQAVLAAKLAESERKLAEQRLASTAEKQQLEADLARQKTALSGCSERNATMYKLGNELLDKYEQKSCFTSVLQVEPFTQLQRAKIENVVEEYRDKLDSQKIEKTTGRSVAGQ